jgi:myo-inositol 2-dehydrogenase / D-chiro-inositol 1-dehydrogenase
LSDPGRDRVLGVGVLGVGSRGRHHLQCIREVPGARVVAIADDYEPSLQQARQLLPGAAAPGDVQVYHDWRGLLDDERVDAAIVVLPNHLHADAAVEALRRDKHVLLEKPVALSLDDCRRIERAARESRGTLQVGLELRYSPVARRLKEEIEAGGIGEPRMAWCHEFRVPFRAKVDDWILDPARSGGTFVEKNCHHFDLLAWLLGGEPLAVAGFGGRDVVYRETPGILDNAWVVVEHAGGKRASLGVSMFSMVPKIEIGVLGEAGLIEGELHEREIVLRRADGAAAAIAVDDPAAGRVAVHGGSDLLQMEDFVATIARGGRPRVTLQDGVRSLLVALAAQRAVDTGAIVALSRIS